MVRAGYNSFRICGNLLQATPAFAWTIDEEIPEETRPQYEGCRENMETQDLLLSFALLLRLGPVAQTWVQGSSFTWSDPAGCPP